MATPPLSAVAASARTVAEVSTAPGPEPTLPTLPTLPRTTVAVWGELVEDIVVRPEAEMVTGRSVAGHISNHRGGSAANTAAALGRVGHPVVFYGHAGDDVVGRHLAAQLTASGVDVVVRHWGRSARVVSMVDPDGQRSFVADMGDAHHLGSDDATAMWGPGRAGVLHLSAYSLRDEPSRSAALAVVALARAEGALISLDAGSPGSITALGQPRYTAGHPEAGPSDLEVVAPDVLFANDLEAAAVSLRSPWQSFPAGVGLVVAKHGADPTVVCAAGRAPLAFPVPAVASVLDTTGAGDAFAAGFLATWAGGGALASAVAAGHALAARVIAVAGAELGDDDAAARLVRGHDSHGAATGAPRQASVLGRLACAMALHSWRGTAVPHTYACTRCPAATAGHP